MSQSIVTGRKRKRPEKEKEEKEEKEKEKVEIEENNKIKLQIRNKPPISVDLISYKLEKSEKLFKEYENISISQKIKRWEKIKKVVDLVEINPQYNFEYLQLAELYEKKEDYKDDFQQFSPTLSEEDYSTLTKEKQENPSLKLFKLLKLYLDNEEEFKKEVQKIQNIAYNIPLIEGNERLRNNYYIILLFLNFFNSKKKEIEKKKIKKGIVFFEELIQNDNMPKFFINVDLNDKKINKKIFTFLLYSLIYGILLI